jgi:hypothetical protein
VKRRTVDPDKLRRTTRAQRRRAILADLREVGSWDRMALYAYARANGGNIADVFARIAELEESGLVAHRANYGGPEVWEVVA